MYLAIAVVRAISIVVDKSMVQSNIISLVVEIVCFVHTHAPEKA